MGVDHGARRLLGRRVATGALVAVALLATAPWPAARGAAQHAAGRVYTLATVPGYLEGASVAVASDATVYVLDTYEWRNGVLRLAPGATTLRRVARAHAYRDVTTGPAGEVLLTDGEAPRVWRLAPDGSLAVAAGANGDDDRGLGGDGGLAVSAQLCSPGAVAVLGGGGFAFADGPYAVRRVGADGIISTPVATVAPPSCAEARPDAGQVVDLAAMPGGALAVLVRGAPESPTRILRVEPGGATTPLKSAAWDVTSIAVTADGRLYAAPDIGRLVGWPIPGSRRMALLRERTHASLFDRDGEPPERYSAASVQAVAAAPDGGLVAIAAGARTSRVLYLAPNSPEPGRLAVALRPHQGRASARGYAASYLATRPGTTSLAIRDRRGRTVATAGGHTVGGRDALTVRRRLPAGVFTVRLRMTGVDGQRAADELRLVLGGRLPLGLARDALRPDAFCGSNCAGDVSAGACRRFGPGRVDCRFRVVTDLGRSCSTGSALLTRYGTVRTRAYRCPPRTLSPFPARPRYEGRGREVAPVQR